jgi:hypothetical protein
MDGWPLKGVEEEEEEEEEREEGPRGMSLLRRENKRRGRD